MAGLLPLLAGCHKIAPRIVGLSSLSVPAGVSPSLSLQRTPASFSNATVLDVAVMSADFTEYRYVVGPENSVDCADQSAYSVPRAMNLAITEDLSLLPDGRLKLCALAAAPGGAAVTASYSWTKDTVAPTVLEVTADADQYGQRYFGATVTLFVRTSEPVMVSGAPSLRLNTGSTDRDAAYAPGNAGHSPSKLAFAYEVQQDDFNGALDYRSASALTGATIVDAAGNALDRTLAAPGVTGSLSAAHPIAVDGRDAVLSFTQNAPLTGVIFPDSALATVTVKNTGGKTVGTMMAALSSGLNAFSLSAGTCTGTLAPGATCALDVTFSSPGETVTDATISVTFDNGSASTHQVFTVTAAGQALSGAVTPLYASAAQWNDYVKVSDPQLSRDHQPDLPCDGSESGVGGCLHGGERRRVETMATSCAGLSLQETLARFNWRCVLIDGTASFVSTGLKDEARLYDLLDASASTWKNNDVRVFRNGLLIAKTAPARWWTNTVNLVTNLTAFSATGTGTIHLVTGPLPSTGISLAADKVAFVVAPAAKVTWQDSGSPNCPSGSLYCLVNATDRKHLWLEGRFEGRDPNTGTTNNFVNYGFLMSGVKFSRFRHLELSRSGTAGTGGGLFLTIGTSGGSSNNLIQWYRAANVQTNPLLITAAASSGNTLADLNVGNTTGGPAVMLASAGPDNSLVRAVFANASSTGLSATATEDLMLSHLTVANNLNIGVNTSSLKSGSLQQLLILNNGSHGLQLQSNDSRTTHAKIFTSGNGGYSLNEMNTAVQPSSGFQHGLWVGDCASAGTWSALSIGCLPNLGYAGMLLTVGPSLTSMFHQTFTETINASPGEITPTNITDWLRFQNPFRAWGRTTDRTMPLPASRGSCANSGPSGTDCAVWDYSLTTGSSALNVNGVFVPGSACPASVSGNTMETMTTTLTGGGTRKVLVNASEILNDAVGNDNGLCESGEACIFSPNIGAYQGHGGLAADTCLFADDVVSGVKMFGYQLNGY